MFDVAKIEKDSEELAILVSELDAYQNTLYPAESNHCLDLSTVSEEDIHCIVVRNDKGEAIGCGAIFLQGESAAEIKRVYIRPQYRGNKIGEKIVASLEKLAAESACHVLRLETGIHQQPAITLYQRCGYQRCDPFPPYSEDPLSVFMYKAL